MAKLQDLIACCEESEIMTQKLGENITELNIRTGNGEITFLTSPEFIKDRILGKPKNIGIVIWLPADVFERLKNKKA